MQARIVRCALLSVPVLAWCLFVASPVVAQDPAPVDPALCLVEPLAIEQLTDLVVSATPVPAEEISVSGESVGEIDAETVTAVITESVACANANQPLRSLALFTDRYLGERFSGAGADDLGHLTVAVTREYAPAEPKDQLSIVAIDSLRLLSDGRIAATVVTTNATSTFTDTIVLSSSGDEWLIDQVVIGESESTPAAGE